MKIKTNNDPMFFELWCFGFRVALRFIGLSIVVNLLFYCLKWTYYTAIEYLAQWIPSGIILAMVIIFWVVLIPYLFALCSIVTGLLGDKEEKHAANQVDPIVTTPVDEVEPQSTQGHP